MKRVLKGFLLLFVSILLVHSLSFSQIEMTFFGQYNVGLSFPDTYTYIFSTEPWADYWEATIGPILEQQNGFGFGARIAFTPVPTIGFEGSFEYIVGGFELSPNIMADLKAGVEGAGYSAYLKTENSGGNILRYYGNVVFNIPSPKGISPYITAGLGITQFKVKKGTGPDIYFDVAPWATLADIQYEDTSALTFNAGGGIKFMFSEIAGLRADARVFYCNPEFNQTLHHRLLGVEIFDDIAGTQSGGLTEVSLNLGFFLKF